MEDFNTTIEEDLIGYLALDKKGFLFAAEQLFGETYVEDSKEIISTMAPDLMPKLEKYLADQSSTKED